MDLYHLLWYFIAYAFIGWCVEVAYAAVTSGKLVNRGFLNGPWCPIYGFGMLAALLCLTPVLDNWVLLFLGGMALTTAIELVGGWVLYKAYHTRWWDYTGEPFNLGGFICLRFSLMWGMGVVLVMRVVHPSVAGLVGLLPRTVGWVLLAVLYLGFAADFIVTLFTVAGLNRDLEALENITGSLREVSDALTGVVGTTALKTDQKLDETQLQLKLARAEARDAAAEAREKLDDLADETREKLAGLADGTRDRLEDALDEVREGTAQRVTAARDALGELRLTNEQRRAELEASRDELEQKAEALRRHATGHRWFGGERLLRAFPHMASERHKDALAELRRKLAERKK